MEDLKKNEFGKAVSALAAAQQKKADMEQEKISCINGFRHSISQGIDPLDIKQHNQYIEKLKQMIKAQEEVIVRAEALVEEKRAELVEAMRDKKAMETLKENDFEEFLEEEKKAEQKVVDEIVSYRGSRK